MESQEAKVKINPVRIRVPKYGNALMLLMEFASRKSYQTFPLIGAIQQGDDYFDVEVRMTVVTAQDVKKYINNNL